MHSPQTGFGPRLSSLFTAIVLFVLFFTITCEAQSRFIGDQSTASLRLSPISLNFGNVQVGTSQSQSETLTNTGTGNLRIFMATTTGSGFSISGLTPPVLLGAGESYTFNVIYAPVTTGSASGSVSFSSKKGTSVSLPLSGTGTAAGTLTVSPSSLNFGNVNVGTTGSMSGTLSASGASVSVTSASSDDSDFVASGLSFPVTIPAGSSVSFTVQFTPQSSGAASASLSFVSNASNSPTVQSLNGTGVGASQHTVGLSWDESSSVSGYNVYRGTVSGGPYSKINPSLDPVTSYKDSSVTGGATYYYVTTAVDSSGMESGYSNEVEAVVPSP